MSLTKATYSMIEGAPVNVRDFGAVGDGITNDSAAFLAAANAINAASGGTLVIPAGTYILGQQTFVAGVGYVSSELIDIHDCTKPVIIEGNGAVLKIANGLRYGSFDINSGAPISPVLPYYGPGSTYIPTVINLSNNANVTVRNFEIDGNVNNLILGGLWGDSGRQIPAYGINSISNKMLLVENIYTHHNALDGIAISWAGLGGTTTEIYPHTLINVISQYNGRQGLSWVGGNNLTCVSCDFSFTGKNGAVFSSPGAGVDIEPESSICRNGTFINCRMIDNTGVGFLSVSTQNFQVSVNSCLIIGTTQYSVWVEGYSFKFSDCTIIGAMTNIYGNLSNPNLATQFTNCNLFMVASASPTGVIYENRINLDFAYNVLFEGCKFEADSTHYLPFSGGTTKYSNCTFKGDAVSGTHFTRGEFIGYTTFQVSTTLDTAGNIYYGPTYVNSVMQTQTVFPMFPILFGSNDGGTGKTNRMVSHFDPLVWAASVGGAIRGDIVYDPLPSSGGYVGSVCTVSGNPGTWKTFGLIT